MKPIKYLTEEEAEKALSSFWHDDPPFVSKRGKRITPRQVKITIK